MQTSFEIDAAMKSKCDANGLLTNPRDLTRGVGRTAVRLRQKQSSLNILKQNLVNPILFSLGSIWPEAGQVIIRLQRKNSTLLGNKMFPSPQLLLFISWKCFIELIG